MKKVLTLCLSIAACGLNSCDYETLPTYSGNQEIYFQYATYLPDSYTRVNDSLLVHFGYDTPIKQDSVIALRVRVQGNVVNYDRAVNFVASMDPRETAIAGTDFELLTDRSFVPAGQRDGFIYVKLKNSEHLNNNLLRLTVLLVPNEHFGTDYTSTLVEREEYKFINSTRFTLLYDNGRSKPNLWADNDGMFTSLFGTYTNKKFDLICEVCALNRAYFSYDPVTEKASDVFNARFDTGFVLALCRAVNIYLKEYREREGHPLLEDDGTEMVLGSMGSYFD